MFDELFACFERRKADLHISNWQRSLHQALKDRAIRGSVHRLQMGEIEARKFTSVTLHTTLLTILSILTSTFRIHNLSEYAKKKEEEHERDKKGTVEDATREVVERVRHTFQKQLDEESSGKLAAFRDRYRSPNSPMQVAPEQ